MFYLLRARSLLRLWHIPDDVILVTLSLLTGFSTGLITVGFVWLVDIVIAFSQRVQIQFGHWIGMVGLMGLAGFIVGLIIVKLASEIQGSGIPEVMEAVALRNGWIRTRVIPLKIIATALTIGTGGSAGREGPIVQVGASIGSTLGRFLQLNSEKMRTLVSCGVAAGISAAFNAPIAASIFALEGVLGSFNVRSFGTVVISAVAGSVVSHSLLGNQPAFAIPIYPLNHPMELLIYAVLGISASVVAAIFIYTRSKVGKLLAAIPLPLPFRAAIGMMIAALISLLIFDGEVLGSGLDWIGYTISLNHEMHAQTLLLLLILKILATSFTLGGGTSGGVFAPSLFIGAALGSFIGVGAHNLWPTIAVNPGAYGLVGMAALFSAAVRTPITAVLIVFEMSNDYKLILPLLLATAISTVLAELIVKDSLYTIVLKAKGITLQGGRDVDVLDSLLIDEIMARDVHTVSTDMTIVNLSDLFSQTHEHAFIMLNHAGKLAGIVTITDLDRAIMDQLPRKTTVDQIGTPVTDLLIAYPDETMGDALVRMGQRGFSCLPVVSPENPRRVVGMIRQEDIIRSYNMAITRRSELLHRAKRSQVQNDSDTEFVDMAIESEDMAVGKTIQEISPDLPYDCILISIRRDGKTLIPHGNTTFQTGDNVTAFVMSKDFNTLRKCLKKRELLAADKPSS